MALSNLVEITVNVNGEDRRVEVDHRWTLLRVLRDSLGLTGAKRGCDRGECGACTVLLDGNPVYACSMLALQVGARAVRTIESLGVVGDLNPLQTAFLAEDGGQCGYCTPGFVMSATALLKANVNPSEDEIKEALVGNLCRCNAYGRIIESVKRAASDR